MTFQFTEFHFWITLILIAAVMAVLQGTCAYLTFLERKISAWIQDRVGPNRVGRDFGVPFGLLQPIADGLKFLFKEQVVPSHVDKLFYFLGPCVAVSTALLAFAVVPFGRTTSAPQLLDRRTDAMVEASTRPLDEEGKKKVTENTDFLGKGSDAPDRHRGVIWPRTETEKAYVLAADRAWSEATGKLPFHDPDPEKPSRLKEYNETVQFVIAPHVDVGVVYIFAIGSLAVYAIVLGGWSSNNKYSFMGALRSSAQLISYEIPLGMSVLGVFVLAGSLNLERIIEQQIRDGWNILFQPLAGLLFITSVFAECNRVPFDLPEAEQELVGGYHTEYSGMKFALYFLGEYTHMITTSFLIVIMFLGGWHLPWLTPAEAGGVGDVIVKLLVLAVKMGLFICFYMFIRWTIPRFRFDQLMSLAWRVMMPLALINLVAVLLVKHYDPWPGYSHWLLLPISLVVLIGAAALSLRMPRQPTRARVVVRGHPVTGGNRVVVN
jgi:NADH:ubiquinone oxidoreductase subunit H